MTFDISLLVTVHRLRVQGSGLEGNKGTTVNIKITFTLAYVRKWGRVLISD